MVPACYLETYFLQLMICVATSRHFQLSPLGMYGNNDHNHNKLLGHPTPDGIPLGVANFFFFFPRVGASHPRWDPLKGCRPFFFFPWFPSAAENGIPGGQRQ